MFDKQLEDRKSTLFLNDELGQANTLPAKFRKNNLRLTNMDWLFLQHTKVPSVKIGRPDNKLSYSLNSSRIQTKGSVKTSRESRSKNSSQMGSTNMNNSTVACSNAQSPRNTSYYQNAESMCLYGSGAAGAAAAEMQNQIQKNDQDLENFYESIIPFESLKTASGFVNVMCFPPISSDMTTDLMNEKFENKKLSDIEDDRVQKQINHLFQDLKFNQQQQMRLENVLNQYLNNESVFLQQKEKEKQQEIINQKRQMAKSQAPSPNLKFSLQFSKLLSNRDYSQELYEKHYGFTNKYHLEKSQSQKFELLLQDQKRENLLTPSQFPQNSIYNEKLDGKQWMTKVMQRPELDVYDLKIPVSKLSEQFIENLVKDKNFVDSSPYQKENQSIIKDLYDDYVVYKQRDSPFKKTRKQSNPGQPEEEYLRSSETDDKKDSPSPLSPPRKRTRLLSLINTPMNNNNNNNGYNSNQNSPYQKEHKQKFIQTRLTQFMNKTTIEQFQNTGTLPSIEPLKILHPMMELNMDENVQLKDTINSRMKNYDCFYVSPEKRMQAYYAKQTHIQNNLNLYQNFEVNHLLVAEKDYINKY